LPRSLRPRYRRVGEEFLHGEVNSAICAAAALALAQAPAAYGITISGQITYYPGPTPVPNVVVEVQGTAISATTNTSGQYTLVGVPDSAPVTIRPRKLDDAGNGVSTLDAVTALGSIVGIPTLTSDEQLACDVTGNGQVSTFDAVYILQAVAFGYQLPVAALCNSDWVFVPKPAPVASQTYSGPSYTATACTHVGEISYGSLSADVADQDFTAILLGDCTGNWIPGTSVITPTVTPTATSTSDVTATETATATATATPTCPAGWTRCPTSGCRDTKNDTGACGGCGKTCGVPGQICADGSCACPTPQEKCDGMCQTLTTDTNCGICGHKCPVLASMTTHCGSDGRCKCADGTTLCGTVCSNLKGNDNCFNCGCVCSPGTHCQGTCCANNVTQVCVKNCE
jgi:hypothetical protein